MERIELSFCFLLYIASLIAIANSNTCGQNEEYLTCGTCEKTCQNYMENIFCTQECRVGCFCKEGYVRNNSGACVLPSECRNDICPKGEIFKECGTACPKTCDNYNETFSCIMMCVKGCFCREGLVRNSDGYCVPTWMCPSRRCGPDEEYYNCVPDCRNTCDNYYRTDLPCRAICKPGCFCKRGLVKGKDGKCVPPSQCGSGICRKDEIFKECGTVCPRTCDNYNRAIKCVDVCKAGCFCKDDLVRRRDGACVPPWKCPNNSCRNDEVFKQCGSACPRTCDNYKESIKCPAICKIGCFCKEGLVRSSEGACIPPLKCPNLSCPENEQPSNCVIPCNTCELKGRCQFLVCNTGCDCKSGYYRDNSGNCIPEQLCDLQAICEDD